MEWDRRLNRGPAGDNLSLVTDKSDPAPSTRSLTQGLGV
jgi:hypothetical protein